LDSKNYLQTLKQKEQEQGLTLLLSSCLKFWMNLRCGIILRTKSQDDEERKEIKMISLVS
jgi:hypothetical protein